MAGPRERVGSTPEVSADGQRSVPVVSVLVVDDQLPFRAVARTVVRLASGFEVMGEAESGEEAIEMVDALHPDLVLMDINMPGISGIEAAGRIASDHPHTGVILLSTYKVSDLPTDALEHGAIGYIHKEEFDPEVLLKVWSSRKS